jgi:hypothetical protein
MVVVIVTRSRGRTWQDLADAEKVRGAVLRAARRCSFLPR